MPAVVSLHESDVLAALRTFIIAVVGPGPAVIRSQGNGVAMPPGDFIAMTPNKLAGLNVPVAKYDRTAGLKNYTQSLKYLMRIDCYGANSSDWATSLHTLLRTDYAVGMMAPNATPLYAEEPVQIPLIAGERQYIERWTLTAVLQYNPTISTPMDFAAVFTPVVLENVDVHFPPEPLE